MEKLEEKTTALQKIVAGFPPPKYLQMNAAGINISDHSIKMLQLSPGEGIYKIEMHADISLPKGTIESGDIKNSKAIIDALKELKKKYRLEFVRASIPEEKGYIFTMNLPQMSDEEIESTLTFQISEHVPLSQGEALFGFDRIPNPDKKSVHLSVSALPAQIVDEYQNLFQEAGLFPLSFEIEAQALARAVVPARSNETVMIADIGRTRTGLSIVHKGVVRYTYTLSTGGDAITNAVAEIEDKLFKEADKIKQKEGFSLDKKHKKRRDAMTDSITDLKREIRKRIEYWESTVAPELEDAGGVEKIILCGGNASVPGFSDHLSYSIKVPVKPANVWVNVLTFDKEIPDMPFNESLGYASAVGLALSDEF